MSNIVEMNNMNNLVTVQINHKIYAAPLEDCLGYPEDFFLNADEKTLEEVGFEFAYGVNAY